jgi:hypothetical protein
MAAVAATLTSNLAIMPVCRSPDPLVLQVRLDPGRVIHQQFITEVVAERVMN